MNKKEKKIVQKFYDSLEYKDNFNNIANKIDYTQKTYKKKYNFKILSTALACVIIVGAIMPFTIEYFNKKYKYPSAEPTTESTIEPTIESTIEPTLTPSMEQVPEPTTEPSLEPTVVPSAEPTVEPTMEPTVEPTVEPTPEPTAEPSNETFEPGIQNTVVIDNVTYILIEFIPDFNKDDYLTGEEYQIIDGYKVFLNHMLAYDEEFDIWYKLEEY